MFDVDEVVARYAVADRSAPHLRMTFISSIDGAATHDGLSGPLNDEADHLVCLVLRMLADVVVVGEGTVHAEGYGALRLPHDAAAWRREHGLPPHPVCAVVSSDVNLRADAELFRDAPVPPIVVTTARAGDPAAAPHRQQRLQALQRAADVMVCGEDTLDFRAMVAGLHARGLSQMLGEGGPHLFGSFIAADVVDELDLTLSPVLEGGSAMRIAAGGPQVTRPMRLEHALPAGDMLFLRYLRAP